MSQENVDFVFDLLAGPVALDKDALLAALPDLIEQRLWAASTSAPTLDLEGYVIDGGLIKTT